MDARQVVRRRAVAEEAARAAGAVHLRYRDVALVREVKGEDRTNYSTRVDVEAHEAARAVILRAFPGEPVVGEEDEDAYQEASRLVDSGCWLVDPLDGTSEYVHGSPVFSAIVSFVAGREPLAAAVYFPVLDELFSAGAGQGASLNGVPIRVSSETDLGRALLTTAYRTPSPERARQFADGLARLLPHIEAFRLPGAPAVSACYVACGRFDVFARIGLPPAPSGARQGQPWETAAFVLLVREAGGAVAASDGGPADVLGINVYAASEALIRQVFAVLSE